MRQFKMTYTHKQRRRKRNGDEMNCVLVLSIDSGVRIGI